jgi:predicted HicB family RNase H-like nuclease
MSKKSDANKIVLHIRMEPKLHEKLVSSAIERDISSNLLINKAIEYYLDHLIPVDDLINPIRLHNDL